MFIIVTLEIHGYIPEYHQNIYTLSISLGLNGIERRIHTNLSNGGNKPEALCTLAYTV